MIVHAVIEQMEMLPRFDPHDADHTEDRSEHETSRQLAHRNPPPVANPNLVQRQRPNNQ